jgi:hypothetical protein
MIWSVLVLVVLRRKRAAGVLAVWVVKVRRGLLGVIVVSFGRWRWRPEM